MDDFDLVIYCKGFLREVREETEDNSSGQMLHHPPVGDSVTCNLPP